MFDEQEFLEAARYLQQADVREGFQRSAVSRAYYSAFLLARELCREREWIARTGSGSDHQVTVNALSRLDPTLASELRNLRQLRNDADYGMESLDLDELATTVQYAIDLAGFIRSELQRLL